MKHREAPSRPASVRFSLLAVIPILLAPLFLAAGTARAVEPLGARYPALSPDGSQLAFSWQGDLWVVAATGGRARRLTDHQAYDAVPHWSPDGNEIAFSSSRHGNHDVFVVAVIGGAPERLTFHSDPDWVDGWSPDGDTIYFESRRESRFDLLYAVPRSGGRPLRVTGDRGYDAAVSPDGAWLAYVRGPAPWWRKHYRGSANHDLWVRPLAGGDSRRLTAWEGNDDRPAWQPDGQALFFQSDREGGVANLFRLDLASGPDGVRPAPAATPVPLTRLTGDGMHHLQVSRDGRLATFESMGALYVVPTDGSATPEPVSIDCPGDVKTNAAEHRTLTRGATEYAFAPGEREVAFVVEGEIYAAVVDGDSDRGDSGDDDGDGGLQDPVRLTETDARERDLAWLDEHTLLFVSDRNGQPDIFLVRSTDPDEPRLGKSRYRESLRLTDSPETEQQPQPSPDGKTILYKRGTRFLWSMNPDGSDQQLLVDEPAVLHSDWSPDSRYVAYSITTLGHAEDIVIFDRESGRSANVSNHPNDDFHPLWTDDGKRLSWASRTDDGYYSIKYTWLTREEADKSEAERKREEEAKREAEKKKKKKDKKQRGDDTEDGAEEDGAEETEAPPPVAVDWEDFPDRIHTVTTVRGFYWNYAQSPDGEHYALRTDVVEQMELWTVDWDGDKLRRITRGGANPRQLRWNEDSDQVRYISGGRLREIANEIGATPSTLDFSVELTVDARARRRQKFDEAWRLLRDGFYDEHFHGVDWPAMHDKYQKLALAAVMHEDFNDVVRLMLGELNASHLGIYGPRRTGDRDRTGLLGFVPDDSYRGPGVRIASVLPHGPLDREGRRATQGEILLAINGRTIAAGENAYALLNHQAGKEVDLRIAGERGAERTITVEPLDAGAFYRLAYKQWTDERRDLVEQLSGGRLGYVHIPGMGQGNWDPFIEDIFAKASGHEGLVLDVRNNGGGLIHDRILTFLSRRPYAFSRARGKRAPSYESLWRWDGPIVLLANERSYSDAEIFPWGFKALELGTCVGVPTFGAVIGTNDVELIDGTGFRIPGTGWYRPDGRALENDAVQPDIRVEAVPEENTRGHDAQLEAAVGECLRQLGDR